MIEKSGLITETSFQIAIESMVRDDSNLSYLEAIVNFCDDNDIEYEEIKKIMTSNLKDKLKLSAQDAGYFPVESTLPI
jgi:uncharacterized protein YdhG (YjbR/CyaY superfamily)